MEQNKFLTFQKEILQFLVPEEAEKDEYFYLVALPSQNNPTLVQFPFTKEKAESVLKYASEYTDLCITLNSYKNSRGRTFDNISKLHRILLDIDKPISHERLEEILKFLETSTLIPRESLDIHVRDISQNKIKVHLIVNFYPVDLEKYDKQAVARLFRQLVYSIHSGVSELDRKVHDLTRICRIPYSEYSSGIPYRILQTHSTKIDLLN